MSALLLLSRLIDEATRRFGQLAEWLVLAAVLVSAGNAVVRYLFSDSSNARLEVQWYLFSAIFLLGAAHTFRMNEHVRVDVIYGNLPERTRLWVDIFGIVFFLLPAMTVLAWMSWPLFLGQFLSGEGSSNAGGLLRWPVWALMPLGFALVALQGVSELIKRVGALMGRVRVETRYEKPLQ